MCGGSTHTTAARSYCRGEWTSAFCGRGLGAWRLGLARPTSPLCLAPWTLALDIFSNQFGSKQQSAMYHVSELKSGLTVATAEMPYMTSISLGIWVGIGSRYEPARLNGICHFIEHLLFKGTKTRSIKEISEAVEGIGGSMNAFTSEEATCFHCRASHDHFTHLLNVL